MQSNCASAFWQYSLIQLLPGRFEYELQHDMVRPPYFVEWTTDRKVHKIQSHCLWLKESIQREDRWYVQSEKLSDIPYVQRAGTLTSV